MIALTGTPRLETDRFVLRGPEPRDAEAYVAFYMSDRAQYVGGPKTRRAAWDFFGTQMGHWILRGFGMFIVTPRGADTPLGFVGHWFPETRPEPEVGWLLFSAEHEGKGIAREAAEACIDFAWTRLGWTRMVSYIDLENARSCALAERLGAVRDPDAEPLDRPCHIYRHRRPT